MEAATSSEVLAQQRLSTHHLLFWVPLAPNTVNATTVAAPLFTGHGQEEASMVQDAATSIGHFFTSVQGAVIIVTLAQLALFESIFNHAITFGLPEDVPQTSFEPFPMEATRVLENRSTSQMLGPDLESEHSGPQCRPTQT